MKAGVLYSGGKDSSLAAIMLGTYYEVELNTFVFDPARLIPTIEHAAQALGFPLRKRVFPEGMAEEMADRVISCGYPNDAINRIHKTAVETLPGEYNPLATAPGLMTGSRCSQGQKCRVYVADREHIRAPASRLHAIRS